MKFLMGMSTVLVNVSKVEYVCGLVTVYVEVFT